MDIENLAAENARLKALLAKQGFKITYNPKTGTIARITAPRKPIVKHTAVNWARKRGYKGSLGLVRSITKDKAIGLRKFKNAMERAEHIRDAKAFLFANGYTIPDKFFNKVPMYVLKNNGFYENVRALFDSLTKQSEAKELDKDEIQYAMELSVERIKKLNKSFDDNKKKPKLIKKLRI